MRALVAVSVAGCPVIPMAHAQVPGCDALFAEARAASTRFLDGGDRRHLHTALEKSREARACFGPERPDVQAETFNYEVYALHSLQRFDEARNVLETFFQTFPVVQDSALWAKMHQRSGYVAERTGRWAEAQQEYARAALYASALPLWRRADLYLAQATAFDLMGDDARALALYEDIADLLRDPAETDPALRSMLGRTLHQIADVLVTQRQRDAAAVQRAVAAAREALRLLDGPDRETARQRVFAMTFLAQALAVSGERDEALALRQQAVQAADAHGDLMLRMQAWYYLGNTWLERAELDAALTALQHGLDLALQYGEPTQAQRLLTSIGEAYEAKGLMQEAASYYRQAIEIAERHRASLGTTEWAATAFADWQTPYRRLVQLHLAQGRPQEAFSLLEQTRARYLRDLRQNSRELLHLDDAERVRLDSLDTEIERLRDSLLAMPRNAETVRNRLAELGVERHGSIDSLDYAPPTPADVQRMLAPGQVVLSYFLDEASYVFVVTAESFRAVPLGVSVAEVDSLVEAVSPLWRGDGGVPSRAEAAFDLASLHALYAALVAPAQSLLPAEASLTIIPEGRLVQIPFAMLLEAPAPRFQYATAPFLVRHYPVATEAAAVMLTDTTARASSAPSLDIVAFGRSEFGSSALPHREAAAALPDLPMVRQEVRALRALVPSGLFALDADASEATLKRRIGDARVVHLASHATVNEANPLYSYIDLWPDTARAEDGQLYLYELAGRHLAADLVVLSGCSTGRGQVLPGEGMNGLHYAFRAAGAGASVATLWHVDDAASGALMERFYVHLLEGMSKDRALQQAQLDYLADARGMRASPFFWAAPVLYGNTAPLAWSERPAFASVGWFGVGVILLLMSLAVPRIIRRRS